MRLYRNADAEADDEDKGRIPLVFPTQGETAALPRPNPAPALEAER